MDATTCVCGAATVTLDNGDSFSMPREELDKHFPGIVISNEYGSCDYCVNHWGIDLCYCGSGQKVGECDEGYPCCGQPAQDIEAGVTSPSGGWL